MPDREKVIKALTDALTAKENYPWGKAEMSFEFIEILLQLLKEDCHNCKLECLLQKYDELKEKQDAMLKEQEATIEILVKDITFHNCNNCNRKDCESKPNAGQPVRSNCIYWLESR